GSRSSAASRGAAGVGDVASDPNWPLWTRNSSESAPSWADGLCPSPASQVLRLEHQVLEQRLVLDVGFVLARPPGESFLGLHELAVVGSPRPPDVVGDDHRAGVQPALV